MISEPQAGTFLDISTGHLTEEEMAFLMDDRTEWPLIPYPEGVFVFVPQEPAGLKEELDELVGEGKLRKETVELIRWASEKRYWFIRFDADGLVYPDLPQFVW